MGTCVSTPSTSPDESRQSSALFNPNPVVPITPANSVTFVRNHTQETNTSTTTNYTTNHLTSKDSNESENKQNNPLSPAPSVSEEYKVATSEQQAQAQAQAQTKTKTHQHQHQQPHKKNMTDKINSNVAPVRRLGDYILGPTLGEGGFSKVKLGVNEKTKEKVALKILKKEKLKVSNSVKQQVEREIAAMEKIKHPNVIRLHEVNWEAKYPKKNGKIIDTILVVLELATGGELFDFLSFTGSFDEAIARTYFHQLISALATCHASGVAHRDLKPENLLLDGDFKLKLADFGFASVFDSTNPVMFTECGTPGYMSPQVSEHHGYDPVANDIWACGVILFIMVAGFPPFQRPVNTDWWYDKLEKKKFKLFWQAHTRTAVFTPAVQDLIQKILSVDPKERYSIEQIKKHEWFAGPVLSDEALTAEFRRRKQTVDEEKNRQKLEKVKQMHVDAVAKQGESAEVTRGGPSMEMDPTSDELPPPLPAFNRILNNPLAVALSDLNPVEESSPFGDFKQPTVEAQLDQDAACLTCFHSKQSADFIFSRLVTVFESLKIVPEVNREALKIKADIVCHDQASIPLRVRVFADPVNQGYHICEFRRRRGDPLEFNVIFLQFRGFLSDIVAADPKASS